MSNPLGINLAAAVLNPLLRTDASKPRITYYDDATGERIELSTVTLANWAAKTGNLLRDELGAGAGSRVAVLLPAHWQTAAVVFGVWWIGAEVVIGGGQRADVAMCTAERLAAADADEVVALSLDPFGRPVDGLPAGVTDYATSVRVQADQIVAEHGARSGAGGPLPRRCAGCCPIPLRRGIFPVMTGCCRQQWDTDAALVDGLLAVFAVGASLVQVVHPEPSALERHGAAENITVML